MGITKGATREFIEDAMTSPKTNGYGAVWIFDHTSRMNAITDALFIPKTLKSVTPSIGCIYFHPRAHAKPLRVNTCLGVLRIQSFSHSLPMVLRYLVQHVLPKQSHPYLGEDQAAVFVSDDPQRRPVNTRASLPHWYRTSSTLPALRTTSPLRIPIT